MASLNFDSMLDDVAKGNINFSTDTFYAMLVTSTYVPNKTTNLKRSDVTNEVVGAGYTAAGVQVAATVAKDTVNNKETVTFANPSWANATITARGIVIYKHRGGAATADELVSYVDFGADVASTNGTFAATFTAPLTFQN